MLAARVVHLHSRYLPTRLILSLPLSTSGKAYANIPEDQKPKDIWMSDLDKGKDKDYGDLFESLKSRVFDPTLQPPPKKVRKFESAVGVESTDQAAMHIKLQVLSNGYPNRIKSFMLITSEENYLFNAGEGKFLN